MPAASAPVANPAGVSVETPWTKTSRGGVRAGASAIAAPEHEDGVHPAEAERARHRDVDLPPLGDADVPERAFYIFFDEPAGRGNRLLDQRERGDHRLDRARRREGVADHPLLARDRDVAEPRAEHLGQRACLHRVVQRRARAVCVDEVDLGRRDARSRERRAHRSGWCSAARFGVGDVMRLGARRPPQQYAFCTVARRRRCTLEHHEAGAFAERETAPMDVERARALGVERAERVEACDDDATERVGPAADDRIDEPELEPQRADDDRVGAARARARKRSHTRERPELRARRSVGAESGCDSIFASAASRSASPTGVESNVASSDSVSNMPAVVPPTTKPVRCAPTSSRASAIASRAAISASWLVRESAPTSSPVTSATSRLFTAPGSKSESSLKPRSPRTIASHVARALFPSAVTAPRPVTTIVIAYVASASSQLDELGERRDGAEDRPRLVALGHANVEVLSHQHRDLECVERVEAEPALAEEGAIVRDARRVLAREIQLGDQQAFDFTEKRGTRHRRKPEPIEAEPRTTAPRGTPRCPYLPDGHGRTRRMGTLVNYMTEKGVAILTLNDPPVNAYSYEMLKELDSCILEARFDNDVHVIVLTGHGEKFFSAGANINMLREADQTFKYYFCLHANETITRLEHTPKLCIAAINGHCVGGGLEIALACDLRVARQGDYQFGLPEVALGVLPGTGGTQRLSRLLGKSKSIELMVEGAKMNVAGAMALGVVNKIWAGETVDEFLRQVVDYARGFCPPNGAAMAVGRIKRAVQSGMEMGIEQGLAFERELQAELFASSDAKEGLNAYGEKRKPQFRGR